MYLVSKFMRDIEAYNKGRPEREQIELHPVSLKEFDLNPEVNLMWYNNGSGSYWVTAYYYKGRFMNLEMLEQLERIDHENDEPLKAARASWVTTRKLIDVWLANLPNAKKEAVTRRANDLQRELGNVWNANRQALQAKT